ncbi:MAG: lysylphosphatidylglycerol synthase transmembrane domain-containing protein [Cyclobacteriaceae bacterium]
MKKRTKQTIQVMISFLVAGTIFYYLYKDIDPLSILIALEKTNLFWLAASVFISIVGYILRAWRWKLLIETGEKFRLSTFKVFWSLMFGYLINLVIPRAGEVARCGAVQKSYQVEWGKLFGTVVLERTIDMLFMVLMVLLAFLLQGRVFVEIFHLLISPSSLGAFVENYFPLAMALIAGFLVFIFFLYIIFRNHDIIRKVRWFLRQFVSGLETVFKLKNQWGFWISSVLIWIIYFFMMFWVAKAMPATASLTGSSVLMVMVMGSIGMVAPVQGGIGTFHALVAFILLFFGIDEEQGKIFAIVVHSSQMFTILGFGMISLIFLVNKRPKKP